MGITFNKKQPQQIEGTPLLFSPNGQWFVSENNKKLCFYNVSTVLNVLSKSEELQSNYSFDFSSPATSIAIKERQDGNLRLWIWSKNNHTFFKYEYQGKEKKLSNLNWTNVTDAEDILQLENHPKEDYAVLIQKRASTDKSVLYSYGEKQVSFSKLDSYKLVENEVDQHFALNTEDNQVKYYVLFNQNDETKLKKINDTTSLIPENFTLFDQLYRGTRSFTCNAKKCYLIIKFNNANNHKLCSFSTNNTKLQNNSSRCFGNDGDYDKAIIAKKYVIASKERKNIEIWENEKLKKNKRIQSAQEKPIKDTFCWESKDNKEHLVVEMKNKFQLYSVPELEKEYEQQINQQNANDFILSTSKKDSLSYVDGGNFYKMEYQLFEDLLGYFVGGIILGVLLIIIIIYCWWRRNKNRRVFKMDQTDAQIKT